MASNVIAEMAQSYDKFLHNVIDAASGHPEKMLEFLASLGGHPKPGFVQLSNMSPTARSNMTRFRTENPELHMILSQLSPAYASVQNRIKMDEAILKQPSKKGNTSMPVRDCIQEAFGPDAAKRFDESQDMSKAISGFPAHVVGQVGSFVTDAQSIVDKIGEVVKLVTKISNFVGRVEEKYEKWLKYIIDELMPALEKLDEKVMDPYLKACEDSEKFMKDLADEQKQNRTAVDSTIPKIVGPNFDAKKMQALATAMDLPIIGVIYRSQVGALVVARYQAQQGRGFIDDYAMMQAAMSFPSAMPTVGSLLGGAAGAGAVASQVPDWFLSNK